MTPQEAIKVLQKAQKVRTQRAGIAFVQALTMACKALELQIQKKPIEDGYYDEPCVCPNCGQALDWSAVNIAEWISIKERLPEPYLSVLVFMPRNEPGSQVNVGFVENGGLWFTERTIQKRGRVTHWMPMPTSPKEGANNENP